MALSKFVAEYRSRDLQTSMALARCGLSLALVSAALSSAVYLFLSNPVGNGLYHSSEVARLIPFSALLVVSGAAYSVVFGVARGCHKVELSSMMVIGSPFAGLLLVLLFLRMDGLEGVFIALFLGQAIVASLSAFWISRTGFGFIRVRMDGFRDLASKLLGYSIPAVLAGLATMPVYWLGNTMLVFDSGLDTLAFFSVGFVFFQSFAILPQAVNIVLIPRLSELSASNESGLNKEGRESLTLSASVFPPILLGIGLFGRNLVGFLYGERYEASYEVLFLLMIAGYFFSVSFIVEAHLASIGKMWGALSVSLVWAISFVVLASILIPMLGLAGLGISYAISYVIRLCYVFFYSTMRTIFDYGGSVRPLLAGSMVMLGCLLFESFILRMSDFEKLGILFASIMIALWPYRRVVLSAWRRVNHN